MTIIDIGKSASRCQRIGSRHRGACRQGSDNQYGKVNASEIIRVSLSSFKQGQEVRVCAANGRNRFRFSFAFGPNVFEAVSEYL